MARTQILLLAAIAGVFLQGSGAQDADDALAAFTSQFQSWAPTVNQKLAFRRSPFGAGVFVEPGHTVNNMEPIMAVPMRLVLCGDTIGRRPYGPILRGLPEHNQIALAVVVEHALGTKSEHAHWLRACPRIGVDMMPPATWPAHELRQVEPKSFRSDAERSRNEIQSEYGDLAKKSSGVLRNLEAWFQKETGEAGFKVTLEDFRWARTLIDTRAWNLFGGKYFVPGADMFNHEPDAEDRRFTPSTRPMQMARSQKFVTHHKVNTRDEMKYGTAEAVAVALSDRGPVKGGSQLHESYGDNTDFIYFNYHGFVPGVPEDFVPAVRDKATKPELKAFAKGWLDERVKRNVWDHHTMPMEVSGLDYLPVTVKAQRRLDVIDQLRRGNWSAPSTKRGMTVPRARVEAEKATRQRRQRHMAKHLPKGLMQHLQRQQQFALYYGEIDPFLRLIMTLSVLPEHVIESDCMKAVEAPRSLHPTAANSNRKIYGALLDAVLRCADRQLPTLAVERRDEFEVPREAWDILGLKAVKYAVRRHALAEFPVDFLDTDNDVALIASAKGVLADDASSADDRHTAQIHVARGRLALQRRMILREICRRADKAMKTQRAALDAWLAESKPGADEL